MPRMPYEYYDVWMVGRLIQKHLCIGIDGSAIRVGFRISPKTGEEESGTPVYYLEASREWMRIPALGEPVRTHILYESGFEGVSWVFVVDQHRQLIFIHDLISALPWAPTCNRIRKVQRRWRLRLQSARKQGTPGRVVAQLGNHHANHLRPRARSRSRRGDHNYGRRA